jgi:hypothetical protein
MPSRHQRIPLKLVTAAVALVATSLVWSGGTFSAFNKTSTMPSNSVTAASLTLSGNDAGTALMTMSSAMPGASVSACENVTYAGGAPALVRLYGTPGGTGLATYLTLTVTRGMFTGTPTSGSCTGFTADSGGTVYSGTLASYPTSTGSAIVDTPTWAGGDKHGYKLTLTLPSGVSSAAQGLSATATFSWLAVTT